MKQFQNILFPDIETAPQYPDYSHLGVRDREVFEKKYKSKFEEVTNVMPAITNDEAWDKVYQDNAALSAEFGKIVSVGMGYISSDELRIKTVVSDDESYILNEFKAVLEMKNFAYICGHNSDEFDNPFTCRRMVVNRIKIPYLLDPTGKKSWDLGWKDTMKIWGFSQWGYKCSLDRLCYTLGIETPKGEMDGAQVKDLFYGAIPGPEDLPFGKFDKQSERFAAIGRYQAGDIKALVNVFLRLNNEPIIPDNKIVLV